ncbi:hypothetical protein HDU93_000021 [Gonapodya sp. JEL0774]|nr:hypothetical protein HDU93_000021 [Gonapodya sp. JEL0774]
MSKKNDFFDLSVFLPGSGGKKASSKAGKEGNGHDASPIAGNGETVAATDSNDWMRAKLPMSFGSGGGGGGQTPSPSPGPSRSTGLTRAQSSVSAAAPTPSQNLGPSPGPTRSKGPTRSMVPTPAPSHSDSAKVDTETDEPDIGPVPLNSSVTRARVDSDSDDDSDEDLDLDGSRNGPDGPIPPPVETEVAIRHHAKLVSALSIDPPGVRLLTGSYDYQVNVHDFTGMDSRLRPFRSFEGVEGCPVRDLAWNTTGDKFLMATTAFYPKLYDREGKIIQEFVKGDMYLIDPKRTVGHTAPLSNVAWHPSDRSRFLTTGGDSTVRIWDVENKRGQVEVIVCKARKRGTSGAQAMGGVRNTVGVARWSGDGTKIACVGQDGALRVYAAKGPFVHPSVVWDGAHQPGTETAGLMWRADGHGIVTRGSDGFVKVWDIRNNKAPVAERGGLEATAPEADLCLSPDERLVVVGTAGVRATQGGRSGSGAGSPASLVFLNTGDLSVHKAVPVVSNSTTSDIPAGVIRVAWHPRLNQVFATTGGGDVGVRVLYGKGSLRGVVQAAGKAVRKKRADEVEGLIMGPIITPASTTRGEVTSVKRKREKDIANKMAARKPEAPATGQGKAGKIGYSLHEQLLKPYVKQDLRRLEDPREAFLKHAEEAANNPTFIAPAYKNTQPEPVFDFTALEDEEREAKRRAIESNGSESFGKGGGGAAGGSSM